MHKFCLVILSTYVIGVFHAISGVWEVPMVMWQDLNGGRCSMGDACSNPSNSDGVYKMLIKNFERHFTTNRYDSIHISFSYSSLYCKNNELNVLV